MHLTKIYIFMVTTFASIFLNSCPTCIGLPRPNERPFFERKAFLSIAQQTSIIKSAPTHQQKNQFGQPLNVPNPLSP
jgi:hypothetical protein